MSVVEIAKETLNSVIELSEKQYAIIRINKLMRMIAAILLVSIFLNDELNLGIPFSKIALSLWDERLRSYLKTNVYVIGICWIVYGLIISNILKRICIYVDKTEEMKSLPFLFTVNDIIDFVSSLYFLTYAINHCIEFSNAMHHDDTMITAISGVYLVIGFINWLYIRNSNNWYDIHREYTSYYDVNNKRIPKDSNVIYYGKLYKVYWSGDVVVGTNNGTQKKEWRLRSWNNNESVSLEQAVKDKEGNLTIETWKNRYDLNE